MKYEFVVQPGADPTQIQLAYRGASSVALAADGQLQVATSLNTFSDAAPVAYQVKAGRRVPVEMRYALNPPAGAGQAATYGFGFRFRLEAYDHSLPLILDPIVQVYTGYIGGAALDYGRAIAIDNSGNAYVTGFTEANETSFPKTVGPDLTYNGGDDAFVAKVKADGTGLAYAGYIGGSGDDEGNAITVDSNGNAYITGVTNSSQATFPKLVGPKLTYNGGTHDAFVAKVNAGGASLAYAGYIGGSGDDLGTGIAVDLSGNAFVVGTTNSTQATFPVLDGPKLTYNGGANDAFIAKVNAGGASLGFAGYVGGADNDQGAGIAVDSSDNVYITGQTYSDQNTFPVRTGPSLTNKGFGDAFVAKFLSFTATNWVYLPLIMR